MRRSTIPRHEKNAAYEHLSGPDAYIRCKADEEAFDYLSGSIISHFFRLNGDCEECQASICSVAPPNSFTQMRKFDPSSNLHHPSRECSKFFKAIDNILHHHLAANIHRVNVKTTLLKHVNRELLMPLTCCDQHKEPLKHFLCSKWIEKSIKIHCRDAMHHLGNKRRMCRKRKKLTNSAIPQKRSLQHH